MDQIDTIDRRCEGPSEGPFCDLLWSDPTDDPAINGYWGVNSRGAGYVFGERVVDEVPSSM